MKNFKESVGKRKISDYKYYELKILHPIITKKFWDFSGDREREKGKSKPITTMHMKFYLIENFQG